MNRKQIEVAVYLPRELESLEPKIRDEVNRRVARGRLTIKVSLHLGESAYEGRVQINVPLAKAYAKEIGKLARELQLADTLNLDLLLRAPGVLRAEDELSDAEEFWPAVEKSLNEALRGLIQMRETEGLHLGKDLRRRITLMRASAVCIRRAAPRMVKRYQQQLRQRISNAGLELPGAEDERLLKEVIYFADRSDISEELTRLESHFNQFETCTKTKEPVGRTLDFLAQEMHREINTIASKAMDRVISREVVKLKAEVERFREQAQNVE